MAKKIIADFAQLNNKKKQKIQDLNKEIQILREQKDAAEKSAKFMESCMGSIAHEMRNPIGIISTNLFSLENAVADNDDTSFIRALLAIKATLNSSKELISSLLIQIKSLSTGKIDKSRFKPTDIANDVNELLATYPFESNEAKLVKLINCYDGFDYIGDSILTKHVLVNLLKNALRAIKQAGKGEITIEFKNDGQFNQLIFIDTALGISEDFLSKIFGQFESKQKLGEGTGLGLSFCKMVMQGYGGDITVTSKKNETKFYLDFLKI